MAQKKSVLKINNDAELLSYIINSTPELREEIDLPRQNESIKEIGKIILDNTRYKNAFINAVNLIGLTIIKRNQWENPWEIFTNRGVLRKGQHIREIIQDLADVFDFNENYPNKERFLKTAVPNVYDYMHELNFQKFYETTVNESELQMCFDDEENGSLTEFVTNTISNLYETYAYDKYLVDKYQLSRRIVDGTITVKEIKNFDTKAPSTVLAEMKAISNKIAFRSPNYNPAGIRRATKYDEQYLILDAEREAINSTEVLAKSYFKEEADIKSHLALIDSFSETDEARLKVLLKDAYVEFTENEKDTLKSVIGVIISDKFFMDYMYALDNQSEGATGQLVTEFRNPTTLDRNVFLHVWAVLSTSPFENACVFVTSEPVVKGITLSPENATVTKGQSIKLTAIVDSRYAANKGVIYSVDNDKAVINQKGELTIPADFDGAQVVVTAKSVYNDKISGTSTITVAE